jgi:hypothetical protein
MQTAATRAIENIAKGFRGFTKPTAEIVEKLVQERLKDFPATTVERGPTHKFGKFCKKHWVLNIHWKVGVPNYQFPTEAEALAAQDAYCEQNAPGIRARNLFLKDHLSEKVEAELRKDYAQKVERQAESMVKATRSDALKALSRM